MSTVVITGLSATSKAGSLRINTSSWYAFYYQQQSLVDGSGTALQAVNGVGLSIESENLVILSPDWYSFYYEQKNILGAYGNANLLINGNTVTTSSETVSVVADSSKVIDGINTIIDFNNLIVTGNANYEQTGLSVNTSNSEISALGDANYQESGLLIETSNSEVSVLSDSIIELLGIGAIIDYGTVVVTGTENVSVIIGGITLNAEFEAVTATEISVIDAEIAVNGIDLTSFIGVLTANTENPQIYSSGQIKRYSANDFKNGSVKIAGIALNSDQNTVTATATSQINATIMLDNVVSFTQIANINAEGVLSINEDELILLMAA